MLTMSEQNKNHIQLALYDSGKKAIAKDIRRGDPNILPATARAAAENIAAEADPTEVRREGARRVGRQALAGAALAVGAAAGVGVMNYAFEHSPSFQEPTNESHQTTTTMHEALPTDPTKVTIEVKGGDPIEGTAISVARKGGGE